MPSQSFSGALVGGRAVGLGLGPGLIDHCYYIEMRGMFTLIKLPWSQNTSISLRMLQIDFLRILVYYGHFKIFVSGKFHHLAVRQPSGVFYWSSVTPRTVNPQI